MLLQSHGLMTAQELSDELEVSIRTIYRDMNALCIAGIPFESEVGKGGGFQLEKEYQSNLHGLKIEEIQALMAFTIPSSLLPKQFSRNLKSALMKLQSKSNILRSHDKISIARCFIDNSDWASSEWRNPILDQLYQAVCSDYEVILHYRVPELGGMEFKRIVQPFGIFLCKDSWFLLYAVNKKIQVRSCQYIKDIVVTTKRFLIPDEKTIKELYDRWKLVHYPPVQSFIVRLKVPKIWETSFLECLKKEWIPQIPTPFNYENEVWIEMEARFDSFEEARKRILPFGGMIKVLEPLSLQYSIVDYAQQISKRYNESKAVIKH